MKAVATGYIQEEQRLAGAVPRVKAVIKPFMEDFSANFGPGLGTFTNCSCPSPGVLQLDSGYLDSASWVSDILQAREGRYSHILPSCTILLNGYTSRVFLRSGATFQEAKTNPWVQIKWGFKAGLDRYWQIKIEITVGDRGWAVDDYGMPDSYTAYGTENWNDSHRSYAFDPAFPGRLENIQFAGEIEIDEEEIVSCGNIINRRPVWFHDIYGEEHTLTVDNRSRQWIPGPQNFLRQDGLWFGKEIHIYTGFELPTGGTDWILQYVGKIRDIQDITCSFTGRHQAKIISRLLLHEELKQTLGAPDADGTRRPYMNGYYKTRAVLVDSSDPHIDNQTKFGSGTAQLRITGTPTNTEDVMYCVAAETTGEIGTAIIKWSMDGGNSWEKSGIVSMTSLQPLSVKNGLSIYFDTGSGDDLVAGDRFYFISRARRTNYRIPGAPFQEITNIWLNGVEVYDVENYPSTGNITIIGRSGLVEARVVKSYTTNPVDIIQDILTECGLEDYLDRLSFINAKMALADYQIGVRFEGIPAWKAIQAICSACLIWFWIDANKIYVSAYTGKFV